MKINEFKSLIKECLNELIQSEAFDPQSHGPNVPTENPYPNWNERMRHLEEDEPHGRYAQQAGAGQFDPANYEVNSVSESMNVSIDGYNYSRKLNDLSSLCNFILDTVISPFIKKLPQDQQAYYSKNTVPFYDMFVPDGSYYDPSKNGGYGSTGIINFYISGFTSTSLKDLLTLIIKKIQGLNIKIGQMIGPEKSGAYNSQVIRIPIIENKNTYNGPPELNLSNMNAYEIFNKILQFEGTHSFTMDVSDLKSRIESLNHDKSWIDKNQRKTINIHPDSEDTVDSEENPHMDIVKKLGGNATVFGLDADKIWSILGQVYTIASWAENNGYQKILVG